MQNNSSAEIVFEKKKFKNKSEKEIHVEISTMGFSPIKFLNVPNYKYPRHKHNETKLLAFLKGKMNVNINGNAFSCEKGDLLIIPGSSTHSAVVGNAGCDFFWSGRSDQFK